MLNDEIAAYADPQFEQYFLVSPEKLRILIDAAGVRETDHVVELGAGVGTVARHIPPCRSLTLVELDTRLIPALQKHVPHAEVIQGDALEIIRQKPYDVLLGNLPNTVTELLIHHFPRLPIRTAVLATGEATDLRFLETEFTITELTEITGDDFVPSQPSVSRLVKVERIRPYEDDSVSSPETK